MSDWAKLVDQILRSPGYIIAGIFLASLASIFVLSEQRASWPDSWISQETVALCFVLLAVLAASLLLAKLVVFISRQVAPVAGRELEIKKWREIVLRLPESARAVLRLQADGGRREFYGEPKSDYVMALRRAGLARVLHADRRERWGRYTLTEMAIKITASQFPRFADVLEIEPSKLASIQLSMGHAERKAGSPARV